ncbi:hypothetical protein MMC25_000620 [Agyrium rufum]|nr:hypothetical protein [Agyrium rufum]
MDLASAFWAAPPVTRTLTAGCFVLSLLAHGDLLPGYWIIFQNNAVFGLPPQIWRLVSSFLISGGGLGIIFDPYFIWQYGSALEIDSPSFSTPGSFFMFILFVGVFIVLTAGFLLGAVIFTHALIIAITWKYAQDNRGKKVTFYIVKMDVRYLPWAIILMSFVMNGPGSAKIELAGIIAAHAYEFLTNIWPTFGGGRNVIATPSMVNRWFGGNSQRITNRGHGTAFQPRTQQSTPQSSTTGSSYFSGGTWGSRGQGHRLGGD